MTKHEIVRDAYVFGYPLVTMDMVRKHETNVREPDGAHAPMGELIKLRSYPPVEDHAAAAPNADTLYTMVWLDVSSEPWVFGIPDMGDRYYIMPMLNLYNEVFFVAGTRTTGSSAQEYAITGPGWSGTLPEGVTQVESPTALVWILGRVYCAGPEDYAAIHELQDRFSSVPLSAYGKPYTPPPGVVDEAVDMETAVRKQVNDLPLEDFFAYLAKLLTTNPPKPEDTEIVGRMAEIGLVPEQDFDESKLPRLGHKLDPKLALLELLRTMKGKELVNGWLYWTSDVGQYGTDYETRALVTMIGPGMNFAEDAVYPLSEKDADGDEYDGSKHRYLMRFEQGQLPPVKGFWSLTMYDPDYFFVPNSIDRYCLSQRDTFVANEDGSVDLYLQAESPAPDKETNWLPAPNGKFKLILRLYWPEDTPPTILDESWTPPPVRRAD